MRFSFLRVLLSPTATDGGAAAGDTNAETKATTKTPPTPEPKPAADDDAAVSKRIYSDNERLRTENERLKGQVPAEGTVVLNKADAARWAELSTLGGLDAVKTQLTEGKAAAASVAKFEREKAVNAAAEVAGYEPSVLGALAGEIPIVVREETKNGKTVKVAEVITKPKDDKGEGEERQELKAYAEANWPKFLPSLTANASPAPKVGGSPTVRRPASRPGSPNPGAQGEAQGPPKRRMIF